MTAQLQLVRAPAPPPVPGIDLRCCDTAEMLASLPDGCADLVIVDAPWRYTQAHGASVAEDHFRCLSTPEIAAHVSAAARIGRRLAMWMTGPLLGEWMEQETPWGRVVTTGTWLKSGEDNEGHYGQGYHWAGCSELVLVYTQDGSFTDRSAPLRNAWVEPPQAHSRKPVGWQTQWIQRWVPPGGLVVDLYAGLASVEEAVLRAGQGRRCIAAEIDPGRHAKGLGLLARVRAA